MKRILTLSAVIVLLLAFAPVAMAQKDQKKAPTKRETCDKGCHPTKDKEKTNDSAAQESKNK